MNAPIGFGALGPGAISIVAELADDRICSVRIGSSRPTHLARLFISRPAQEIPVLVERLYSLCGFSHAMAATHAIAAARGEAHAVERAPQTIGLLCERLSETLRSSMTSTVRRGDAFALDEKAIRPLREILSLTRELTVLAVTDPFASAQNHSAGTLLIQRIRAVADELGLSTRPQAAPPTKNSLFGRLWRELESDRGFAASVPDALGAEDDAAILDGLRRNGERFAAAPWLAGRAPETGAFARHWRDVDFSGGALPARLHARMIDLARCLKRLTCTWGGDATEPDSRSAAPALREGFAAVETSRGDLYHWARLTSDDKISDYAIVAPTEWNFHPAGPFVAALLGARIPRGDAHQSIVRLASLFDPCVVFRVEVMEAAHA